MTAGPDLDGPSGQFAATLTVPFSDQAPEFYEKLGYRQFGRLEDFPPGSAPLFYRKRL